MFVSLNWLKDFVQIKKPINQIALGQELTLKTAEIEKVIDESKSFNNIVVGHVITLLPHPNADKLRIAKTLVDNGQELQIVCGGENLREGMYVAVAKIGASVKWHGEGEPVVMEKAKIRIFFVLPIF